MSRPVDILLVGIGGYGNNYVTALLDRVSDDTARIVGCVDPTPSGCNRLNELQLRGVPIYPSIETFFANATAELAVISTPLHLHAPQTVELLQRGCHVLCEKPLCVTHDEAAWMVDAERQTRRLVSIGYQWSFSDAIQAVKRDVIARTFGKPLRFRTLALWPRDQAYYGRSNWAGKQHDDQGVPIFDSPASNACAHFLHNMFYLLGATIDQCAEPATVTAELHRANAIQNYDTAAIRCVTANDVEVLFITSHATSDRAGPHFSLELEHGVIEYRDGRQSTITARSTDGRTKDYGSPNDDRMRKLWRTIDDIRNHHPSISGIAAASGQLRCVCAAQQSPRGILNFPTNSIRVDDGSTAPRIVVNGLDAALQDCYQQWKLPSELGLSWSQPSAPIRVAPGVFA